MKRIIQKHFIAVPFLVMLILILLFVSPGKHHLSDRDVQRIAISHIISHYNFRPETRAMLLAGNSYYTEYRNVNFKLGNRLIVATIENGQLVESDISIYPVFSEGRVAHELIVDSDASSKSIFDERLCDGLNRLFDENIDDFLIIMRGIDANTASFVACYGGKALTLHTNSVHQNNGLNETLKNAGTLNRFHNKRIVPAQTLKTLE